MDGESTETFTGPRGFGLALVAGTVGLVLALVLLVWILVVTSTMLLLLAVALVVYFLAYSLSLASRMPARLILTRDGIETWNYLGRKHGLPWQSVDEIFDFAVHGRRGQEARLWIISNKPRVRLYISDGMDHFRRLRELVLERADVRPGGTPPWWRRVLSF